MRKFYLLLTLVCGIFFQTMAQDATNFTITISANFDVTFTNTTVINGDGPRKAYWSFGDGTKQLSEPLASTKHHYAAAGTYTACLRIYKYSTSSNDSVITGEFCKTFTLHPPDASCGVTFTETYVATSRLAKLFVALPKHSADKTPEKICWNFGDGSDTCINYNPSVPNDYAVIHKYNQPGEFEVCVKIIYQGGCDASYCHITKVGEGDLCKVDYSVEGVVGSPLTKKFKALPAHLLQKRPVRICWDFGDGRDTCIQYPNTSNESYSVIHKYSNPGQYNVCVKVLYDGGCETHKCKTITINEEPTPDLCKVDYSVEAADSPLAKKFKALTAHQLQKKPVRICWDFGDGRDTCIQYSNTSNEDYSVIHKYNNPGHYNVCVKVLYDGGCETDKCNTITINEPTPDLCKVDYSAETVVGSPLAKKFKALPAHLLQKRPVRICWIFGDGRDTCIQYPNTSNESYSVIHKYSNPGQYNVCVKVLYDGGCETDKCKTITINEPAPDGCRLNISEVATNSISLDRHFYATTSPDRIPEKICWDFGDGSDTCIILPNPLTDLSLVIGHRYPGPGVYRVCAKILYAGGCTAHSCREVVIRSSTNICGGYMTDSLIAPKAVLFKGYNINSPNDHVISWRWTFGDGTGATGREVKHEYANGGKYEVCLYIKTDLGCETKICKFVVVRGDHQAQLKLSPNPVVSVLHAVFLSRLHEQVTINIYNVNGILVRTYTRLAVMGSNSWEFDLSNLPSGIYSVVVHSPNQLANAIFFKR